MLPSPTRILIVDDDPIVGRSLAEYLRSQGSQAEHAATPRAALEALAAAESEDGPGPFQVVVCDLSLPGMDGLDLLRQVQQRHPAAAVVMLTAYGTIESAVKALRLGAVDYLTKPLVDAELLVALERALRQHHLLAENRRLRRRADAEVELEGVVGADPRMRRILDLARAVAGSRTTVLMTGESGVGKSLIAQAIHRLSPRRDRPFVELSCGSIPETLLESELFGHVKGAFTGAHADKAGRFAAAHTGTIFLDEINSATPAMQLKLLRVLQERKFEPVGSSQTVEVDVRVLLASNQPLERLVAEGVFRQDLYYRINVVAIEVPPLRERLGDIPLLADRFLRAQAVELNKQLTGFTPEALRALLAYPYPGNVRELANIVERAAVLAQRPTIALDDLPPQVAGSAAGPDASGGSPARAGPPAPPGAAAEPAWSADAPIPLEEALKGPERRILLAALEAHLWNRQKTAAALGINRTTLYKKMKAHGLEGPERRMAG